MGLAEGEGSSEEACIDVETNTDSLDVSMIFHVVNDAIGFVLYMHQQIPAIMQDMSNDIDAMRTEYKELEADLTNIELKPLLRRKLTGRKREVKHEIRKVEKFMNTVASLQNALQLMISENPSIHRVMLVLGGSPMRPQQVYELYFPHGVTVQGDAGDLAKSKVAEGLSRKAIRALISKGAGSGVYPGPMKLFLLVNAPSSFNLPLHFLPRRDFKHSKKIVPLRLRFKCRTGIETHDLCHTSQTGDASNLTEFVANNIMWFQCRHVIKGLALPRPAEE